MIGKKLAVASESYMKRSLILNLFLIFLVPVVFLAVSFLTLNDYGINWDEPKHLIRGQSYLHFILTGKKDFCDMPSYPLPKGAPDYVDYNVDSVTCTDRPEVGDRGNSDIRRSYFQSDFYTFDYFMTKHVHTHPEVNNLLLAFSNYIFFQKLGIVGDIEAYHLFIVFVTFILLAGVGLWVYYQFGILASFVAAASLGLYPLVFSESHFNIKDPVLMSFFGLAILAFWYGFSRSKAIYILVSAVSVGFALGTKFNTLFLPFILGPWVLYHLFVRYRYVGKKKFQLLSFLGGRKVIIAILAYPFIALAVLYLFSPYLWGDPIGRFMGIVDYYRDIGTGTPPELSAYLIGGWNMYPLVWTLYTTPLPILLLSIVGIFYSTYLLFRRQVDSMLIVLLWLLMPIMRVVWPGMNVYGGVRQIMEFMPAMAILAGIGAFFLIDCVRPISKMLSKFVLVAISLSLMFVVYEMVRIHPNQNVYFNQLVGGLSGAYKKKIPSWGNTYGNVYLQGINWLNKNAEQNAKLALAVNYISVVPRLKLREDISLDNAHWSGPGREGEYVMEMSYDWPLKSRYKYAYYETFLEPVYQVEVDGIPLLKIWKNDPEHTKVGYEKEVVIKPLSVGVEQQKIKVDFANQVFLTRLVIEHSVDDCNKQGEDGFMAVSQDGESWAREPSPLYDPESPYASPGMDESTFVFNRRQTVFMFPARPARSIIFNSQKTNPCVLKNYKVTVMGLERSL